MFALGTAIAQPARAEPPTPLVQRWGLDGARAPVDYHAGTGRLLTTHGGSAVLWDTASGLAVQAFEIGGDAMAVALGDDGSHALTVPRTGRIRVWDVDGGQVAADLGQPHSEAFSAALSPDGRYVAVGHYDHTVSIWDARTGERLHLLDGHRGHVISVRFSPDTRRLLSGAYDHQAILWDVETGRRVRIFPTPAGTRWSAFRADGRRFLTIGSGTERGGIRIVEWDVRDRRPLRVIRESARAAWFVDSSLTVLTPDNELRQYRSVEANEAETTTLAPALATDPRRPLAVTPDGWQIVFPELRPPTAEDAGRRSEEPAAGFLRSPAGEPAPLPLPRQAADALRVVDVSDDGLHLLATYRRAFPSGDQHRIVLWDLETPRVVHTFPGEMGRFHPDGHRVLAGERARLQLYRITDGRVLQTYSIDRGAFESARFVAGGRQLLTASGNWYDGDDGQLAGTADALERVAWRVRPAESGERVIVAPQLTAERLDAGQAAEVLTRSLPDDQNAADLLARNREAPTPANFPEAAPTAPSQEASRPPSRRAVREKAAELLERGGAELRTNSHGLVTFVHLEGQTVTDGMLQMLPWLSQVDRLYLADTGITDQGLHTVGLMTSVKRLSLWGNPITDAGLAELAAMWSLEVLDVHDTSVTREGLRRLRLLPRLRTLIVPEGTDVGGLAHDFDRPGLKIVPR